MYGKCRLLRLDRIRIWRLARFYNQWRRMRILSIYSKETLERITNLIKLNNLDSKKLNILHFIKKDVNFIHFSISQTNIVVAGDTFACTLIWWPRNTILSQIFHISCRSPWIYRIWHFRRLPFFYIQT